MAEISTSDVAEVLVALRIKLVKIVLILVAVWAISFVFLSDFVITKIIKDLLPEGAKVVYTSPLEGLILKLKISLDFGFLSVLPYVSYLVYKALKNRTELLKNVNISKSVAFKYGISAVILFILGLTYGYCLMLPLFMRFLYQIAVTQGATPLYSISDFIGFVVLMLIIFGLIFQMPLIMILLVRYGIVKFDTLKYYRRHFYVLFFIIGAAITPPDVFTQLMVAIPMLLFYEISLVVTKIVVRV